MKRLNETTVCRHNHSRGHRFDNNFQMIFQKSAGNKAK